MIILKHVPDGDSHEIPALGREIFYVDMRTGKAVSFNGEGNAHIPRMMFHMDTFIRDLNEVYKAVWENPVIEVIVNQSRTEYTLIGYKGDE